MHISRGKLAKLRYPPLDDGVRATFQDRRCEPGWIQTGVTVYRYGSDASQSRWSRGPWVNATTDRIDYADEAIEQCSLLDATMHGLQPMNAGRPTGVWNTAAWRCALTALQPVPVYVGVAAPLAFDLFTSRVYRGPGDQLPHRSTPGGAMQILIPGDEFDRFLWSHPLKLQSSRLPT